MRMIVASNHARHDRGSVCRKQASNLLTVESASFVAPRRIGLGGNPKKDSHKNWAQLDRIVVASGTHTFPGVQWRECTLLRVGVGNTSS